MKKLLSLLFAFIAFTAISYAQPPDPPSPDCSPRDWTLSGTSAPTAGVNETYTVSPSSDTYDVTMTSVILAITASSNSLFKAYVDGTLYTFNAGQTRSFTKSVADCTPQGSASRSWSVQFTAPGRSGIIALTYVNTTYGHTIGNPDQIFFTTQ